MKMVTFWGMLKIIEGEPTEKNVRGIKCWKWWIEYKYQVTRRLKTLIFSQNYQKYAKCSVLFIAVTAWFSWFLCSSCAPARHEGSQSIKILSKSRKNKFWKANKTTWIENWVKRCYIPFLNMILNKFAPLHFFQRSLFLWVFNTPQKWSFLVNFRLKCTT